MKITFLFILCSLSFTASAQWWNVFKKHERLPLLAGAKTTAVITADKSAAPQQVVACSLSRSDFSLEAEENYVMKTAQHNMRFRIYDLASYNFSKLAQLYNLQGRFSEAKWYFLQSNILSRQQNNDRLTLFNLCMLADVKSEIGDFALAQQDLLEAHNIAVARNWRAEMLDVDKRMQSLKQRRVAALRPLDTKYAEAN